MKFLFAQSSLAKVVVLQNMIETHVKMEEKVMFPLARERMDAETLAALSRAFAEIRSKRGKARDLAALGKNGRNE